MTSSLNSLVEMLLAPLLGLRDRAEVDNEDLCLRQAGQWPRQQTTLTMLKKIIGPT